MPKKKDKDKEKETVRSQEEAQKADEGKEPQGSAEEEPDEKEAEIERLQKEASELKEKYLRLAAEYDNYRKRTSNEKLKIYDDATAKAVTELLPVADSVRMALENLKDADPEILKGIELISNQLKKSFEKLKIEAYGAVGDEFDPNIHNAISKVESDELEENQISQVFQTGYKIGDKIIRHAMVQVVG